LKSKEQVYDGEWNKGKRSGQGKEKSADKLYVGAFEDDLKNGFGELYEI
jgi:hypothetical protein